ncbi:RedB protein [bacterium]|nr:RedB protein [bacterium]
MRRQKYLWVLWLGLAWLGILGLADHECRPALSARAPAHWPVASKLHFSRRSPILLLFLHPGCPCSRACLAELRKVRLRSPRAFDLMVVIGLPGQMDVADAAGMMERVRSIDGSRVFLDKGLPETSRFGCYTSGQALLYSRSGRLRYQGGLTGSRGHEGDNANSEALLAALAADGPGIAAAPVFGCGLRKEEFCAPR